MSKGFTAFAFVMLAMHVGWAQAQATIKEITVTGNKYISKDAVLSSMQSKVGDSYSEATVEADKKALLNIGVFKKVEIYTQPLEDNSIKLMVQLDENPYIKEIRISGNTAVGSDKILPLITQKPDAVFNLRTVGPTIDAISSLYDKRGYFADVDIAPLEDSPETLNVQIIERSINNIKFSGLTRTRPSVLRRLLKTKPGSALNRNTYNSDLRRLEASGWFESLQGSFQTTSEVGKLDWLIDVKELRTGIIGFGATLDPQSRLAGSLNYTDSNIGGTGQRVGVSLQQDTVGNGLSASFDYSNPYFDSRDTAFSLRLYSRINSYFTGSGLSGIDSPDNERFDERRNGAQIAFTRPFRNIYSASLGVSGERVQTLRLRTTETNFIQQDGDLVTFLGQVARDTRDVPLDPMEGDYARITIEPGFSNISKIGGTVGTNTDILGKHKFLRNTLEYKQFWSKRPKSESKLNDPRKVLAFRARYGTILGTVPFFEQFFLGGSDSLRGYADQRFWGKNVLLTTVEYRVPVQKNFNLIGFADYGGAWGGYGTLNDFVQSRTASFHLGYGMGVGFRTPLGPIRVDFGFNGHGGSRTHFSIGGSF
ncbi:MAG: BamA/TamA family outer membrane protein [Armatimonadetes bacterium]|nr:BamA/TamA family outer membrane protein [Armatimonadota bacterium]